MCKCPFYSQIKVLHLLEIKIREEKSKIKIVMGEFHYYTPLSHSKFSGIVFPSILATTGSWI